MISGLEVNLSQVEQPAVIKRTGSFFTISTWVCLAVSTLWAISTTTDNNFFYFIPVTLYIAWMRTFLHVSDIKEKGLIWQQLPPTPVRWKWDNKSPTMLQSPPSLSAWMVGPGCLDEPLFALLHLDVLHSVWC